MTISFYKNGYIDGTKYLFCPNGRAMSVIEFKSGVRHGKSISYSNYFCTLLDIEYFEYGSPVGTSIYYWGNGKTISFTVTYLPGGVRVNHTYNFLGRLKKCSIYEKDKLVKSEKKKFLRKINCSTSHNIKK